MIYYTSDLHLGHKNIIRHCQRPFESIDKMDEVLIRNWNQKVSDSDHIYIVGDFIFRAPKGNIEWYFNVLKGHKHLIVGNHDRSWIKQAKGELYGLESVDNLLFVNDKTRIAILCHYPMMTWPGANKGAWMVYGHIHANTHMDFWPFILQNNHMVNAGVDVNNFEPVTLEEMIENNRRFKAACASAKEGENT